MKRPNLLTGTICVEMVDLLSLLKRFDYKIYCRIYIFQKIYCKIYSCISMCYNALQQIQFIFSDFYHGRACEKRFFVQCVVFLKIFSVFSSFRPLHLKNEQLSFIHYPLDLGRLIPQELYIIYLCFAAFDCQIIHYTL